MTPVETDRAVLAERARLLAEYRRRESEIDADRYAPWLPATAFLRAGRTRLAAGMLKSAGVFPSAGDACLEVGYGSLGWLGELIAWGMREQDLHGIELDEARARKARAILPGADLRVGDATRMPFDDGAFRLIVVSTVFSSILDDSVRGAAASEIIRVMSPGGAMLWYDMTVDNPNNEHVRGLKKEEIRRLFSGLSGSIRSATLAPPLVRLLAPRIWWLAQALEAIPVLRTHCVAVLSKRST